MLSYLEFHSFSMNYLRADGGKTQLMILGNSIYHYDLEFDGTFIDIKEHLKILEVCLDNKLSFKEHTNVMLKRV